MTSALQSTVWQAPIPADIQAEILAGRPVHVGESVEFRRDSIVVFRALGQEVSGHYRVVDSTQVHVRFTSGLHALTLGERTLRVHLSVEGDTLIILPNPLALGQGPGTFVPAPGSAAR
jgi:hypothetical protein